MYAKILINTNKSQLNIELIHAFITNSYWAKGRSISSMQTCIDNSLNYGMYIDNHQIGYARIVTDYTQFAYLMDVFIIKAYQGKGYGKKIISYIMNDESLKEVKTWRLATADAHGLYQQFGFTTIEKPENLMELIK